MEVINKTTKIIGIGETPVLPGEAIPITDDVAASPMIQHLASIGKIALEPDATPSKGKSGGKGKGKTNLPTDSPADPDGGKKEGGASEGSDPANGTA